MRHLHPFIPSKYISEERENYFLWHSIGESDSHIQALTQWVDVSLNKVQTFLEHSLNRQLHICLYHSFGDAHRVLSRNISKTALLIPFSSKDTSMIALLCHDVSKDNANETRMIRHLTHEITHLHLFEMTNSSKVLGDNNSSLYIRPWLSEGIAEFISFSVTEKSRLTRIHSDMKSMTALSENELDQAFDNLNSDIRSSAFIQATSKVTQIIEEIGLKNLLKQIRHSEHNKRFV